MTPGEERSHSDEGGDETVHQGWLPGVQQRLPTLSEEEEQTACGSSRAAAARRPPIASARAFAPPVRFVRVCVRAGAFAPSRASLACVRACVHACVRVHSPPPVQVVHACVRACVRVHSPSRVLVCACLRACVRAFLRAHCPPCVRVVRACVRVCLRAGALASSCSSESCVRAWERANEAEAVTSVDGETLSSAVSLMPQDVAHHCSETERVQQVHADMESDPASDDAPRHGVGGTHASPAGEGQQLPRRDGGGRVVWPLLTYLRVRCPADRQLAARRERKFVMFITGGCMPDCVVVQS